MKKIVFIFSALALVIGMSSCQKEETNLADNDLMVTATFDNGIETRVTYEEKSSPKQKLEGKWAAGDIIFGIWTTPQTAGWKNVSFRCTSVKDGVATFDVSKGGEKPADGATVNVAYFRGESWKVGKSHIEEFPLEDQDGRLEGIGKSAIYYASGKVSNGKLHFEFHPAVAVIKMNLNLAEEWPMQGGVYAYPYLYNVSNALKIDFTRIDDGDGIEPVKSFDPSGSILGGIFLGHYDDNVDILSTTPHAYYAVIPATAAGADEDFVIGAYDIYSVWDLHNVPLIKRSESGRSLVKAGELYEITRTIEN